jgi:hypothetical protein
LTQTNQLRLAIGDIAATSVTDSKATQTLSLPRRTQRRD